MASISRFKKLFLGTALSLSLIIPVLSVNAQTITENQGTAVTTSVQPRAAICPQCRVGRISTSVTFRGEWDYTGESTNCKHGYIYGKDYTQSRIVTKRSTCSNSKCNYSKSYTTTETKIICKGSYNP